MPFHWSSVNCSKWLEFTKWNKLILLLKLPLLWWLKFAENSNCYSGRAIQACHWSLFSLLFTSSLFSILFWYYLYFLTSFFQVFQIGWVGWRVFPRFYPKMTPCYSLTTTHHGVNFGWVFLFILLSIIAIPMKIQLREFPPFHSTWKCVAYVN